MPYTSLLAIIVWALAINGTLSYNLNNSLSGSVVYILLLENVWVCIELSDQPKSSFLNFSIIFKILLLANLKIKSIPITLAPPVLKPILTAL